MIISQSNRNFNILTIEKSEDVLYNYNKIKYARAKIPIGERTMKNTTLIYIEKDGNTLLLHRTKKKNDLNHDLWVGIGGHCEEGESPEDCALREAKEETGLTLTEYKYRGVVTFVSDKYEGEYMHLFTSSDFVGDIIECDEGDLEWIENERVLSLPAWEGDRIFLELLRKNEPFFSLKLVYKGSNLAEAVLNGKKI